MNFNRVVVTKEVRGADGRLRVAKGAIGTIRSWDRGQVGIVFEDDGAFVELSGCNRRIQSIPFINVQTVEIAEMFP